MILVKLFLEETFIFIDNIIIGLGNIMGWVSLIGSDFLVYFENVRDIDFGVFFLDVDFDFEDGEREVEVFVLI